MYDVFYSPRGGNEAVPKALSFRMMCVSATCPSEAMTAAGHDDSSPVEDGPEELAEVVHQCTRNTGKHMNFTPLTTPLYVLVASRSMKFRC